MQLCGGSGGGGAPASPRPAQLPLLARLRATARDFSPAWYAACSGSAVTSVCIANFPYQMPAQLQIGWALWWLAGAVWAGGWRLRRADARAGPLPLPPASHCLPPVIYPHAVLLFVLFTVMLTAKFVLRSTAVTAPLLFHPVQSMFLVRARSVWRGICGAARRPLPAAVSLAERPPALLPAGPGASGTLCNWVGPADLPHSLL